MLFIIMIFLKMLINEIVGERIAVLLRNPVELVFSQPHESTHAEIVHRVCSTKSCSRSSIGRIVITQQKLYFNTYKNEPLTEKQLSFLKNYCIENHLKLIHSGSGVPSKEIDLLENVE